MSFSLVRIYERQIMTSSIFFPPATHLVSHSTFFRQSHSDKNVRTAPCLHKNSLKKQAWDLGLQIASVFSNCLLPALTAKVYSARSLPLQLDASWINSTRRWKREMNSLFPKADYKIWRPRHHKDQHKDINTLNHSPYKVNALNSFVQPVSSYTLYMLSARCCSRCPGV